MPKTIPLTQKEKLERREDVARRAASGALCLPGAIRDIRKSLGLTQVEFGKKFGLTRMQVIALEKGTANPTQETLERISRPFGFVIGFVPRPR